MRSRKLATLGIMACSFLAAMDTMAVGPALPSVVADVGNVKLYFLVFCVYLVASTVTVPIWGRLSDSYGRLRFLVIGVLLFLAGSVLCGQARSMVGLVVFRGLQGIGAGALMPLGFTMLADMYDLEERAKMQGLLSSVWGVASIVGPIIGGFLTETWSWRAVFYINVPVGGVALGLIVTGWHFEPERRTDHRQDLLGAGVFTAAMTALLTGLALLGRREFGWHDPRVVGCLAGGLAGVPLTLWIEARHPEPFIDLTLFRNRVFVGAAATGFFAGVCLFAISAYGPLFLQGVVGTDAKWAGLALTPMSLGWVVCSSSAGFLLLHLGYRVLAVAGGLLICTGYWLLTGLGPDATWSRCAMMFGLVGCGLGCLMAPMLIAVQNAVPRPQLGAATSLTMFLRTIGGSLGLAVMGVLFAARLGPLEEAIGFPVEAAVGLATREGLAAPVRAQLQTALAGSIQRVFTVGLGAAALVLLATCLVPRGRAQALALSASEELR